jgi:hypothetical protein
MKINITHCCVALLIILSGCANYNVNYTRTPGTDYSKYKTYAWIPADSSQGKYINRKHLNDRIMYYANDALGKKGMTVNTTNPDAAFRFYTYTEDKVEYQYTPPPAYVSFGFRGPGYYMGYSPMLAPATVTPHNYKEGTLVIEMLDVQSQQVVWKGEASSVVDRTTDIDKVLNGAIRDMTYTLPIRIKTQK